MKPIRTCLVCRNKFIKNELFRFVKEDGQIVLDKNADKQARGAYVCKSKTCIDKMFKQKALNRAFRTNVTKENYDIVLNQIQMEG